MGVGESDPGRGNAEPVERDLEMVGHGPYAGSGADLGGDLDEDSHGLAATRSAWPRAVGGSSTSSLLRARAAAPIQIPAITKGTET